MQAEDEEKLTPLVHPNEHHILHALCIIDEDWLFFAIALDIPSAKSPVLSTI